jgi:hypothetical protein
MERRKRQMKTPFEIVQAWLHPKEPDLTEKELKEIEELLESVRVWEAHYLAHETPEQRRERIFFEKMRGFIQF